MSMEHKAYVFDYDNFTIQLFPTLIDALKNNNKENLINFIQHNIKTLKDPDTISTADKVWQDIMPDGDINELGDFALTKFYDPDEDIGLNYEWWNIEKILKIEKTLDSHTIHLGNCIVSGNNCFNPGKFGSYFQSPQQVMKNHQIINRYIKDCFNCPLVMFDLKTIFSNAILENKGLYITF